MRTAFAILLESTLSGVQNTETGLIVRAIADNLEGVPWVVALALWGAPSWFPYPGVLKARRGRRKLREVLDSLLVEARRGGARDDLLSMLTGAHDPETGSTMSDTDLRDNLLTFITARHETTAQALTWTFYLLSLYPGIEQQARAEIALVTCGAALRPDQVDALAFTNQVIQEPIRPYPPPPLLSPHPPR